MGRPALPHMLRDNRSERSPHRLLVFDTETTPIDGPDGALHVLRLWCARYVRRHDVEAAKPRTEDFRGHTAEELADLVTRFCRRDGTLWVFAHNLAFDLAVTGLVPLLLERGFTLSQHALVGETIWCRLARGRERICIADTFSWLPTSVAELGKLCGIPKVDLPTWGDDDEVWFARCATDVAITTEAICALMDWWDDAHAGCWSVTGPATGWASYRHAKPPPRVHIDPDPEARAWEHAAITSGRREVRRIGRLRPGLYVEVDLVTAHLVAMATHRLPARRLRRLGPIGLDEPRLRNPLEGILAEVTVRVGQPCWPWDSGKGIFYPVGRFRTRLSGPELTEALDAGHIERIHDAWLYATNPHMAAWATWVASLMDETNTDVHPVVALAAKAWSRSVAGRWAARTGDVLESWPDPRPGWLCEQAWFWPQRRPGHNLVVGGTRYAIARDAWTDDAFPAVLAWIQGATRVAVRRLVNCCTDAVIVVSTDGVILDAHQLARRTEGRRLSRAPTDHEVLRAVDRWARSLDPALWPFQARVKKAWRRLEVISPQHIIGDDEHHLAGIPKRAVRIGDRTWRFRTWPKLHSQLEEWRPPSFRAPEREVTLTHIPPTGWLHTSNAVTPVRLDELADGSHMIFPPGAQMVATDPLAPAELQHPVLQRAMVRPAIWPRLER